MSVPLFICEYPPLKVPPWLVNSLSLIELLEVVGFYHASIYNDDAPHLVGFAYMNFVICDLFDDVLHSHIIEYIWGYLTTLGG